MNAKKFDASTVNEQKTDIIERRVQFYHLLEAYNIENMNFS